MTRLPSIALLALTALGANAADAKKADADAVQAAYDVTMKEGGRSESFVLVFTRDRLGVLPAESPETLVLPLADSTEPSGNLWMPYTSDAGKGTFTAAVEGEAISGSIKGDKLTGKAGPRGMELAFTGTRSHKHYKLEKAVDPTATLDEARELELARKPKEAIELYAKVIENDRYDTMHAGPALVDLVECYQLLKDDAAMAKRGTEALERYLSDPPPLDGAHAVTLDTAEEDLLWKPWPEVPGIPAKPLLDFKLASAEQKRQMKEGVISETTEIMVEAKAPSRMRFADRSHRDSDKDCTASVTLADGSIHQATRHYGYAGGGSEVRAQLTFADIPGGTKKLAKLAGTVTVSQEQEWELKKIPLRDGETWDTPEASCKLAGAKEQGGAWTITVVQTRKNARGWGGSSSSSSSSSGGTIDGPIWLSDDHGARMLPHNVSEQGNGATTTITMAFSVPSKPTTLMHRIVTKTSTRDLAFALSDVELP